MKKTVLITGCSSGFGLSITKALLQDGWRVIATARNIDSSVELTKLTHSELMILPLDVTNELDRLSIQEYIANELNGNLDCLINNAGYGLFGPLEELTEEQIRHQLEVNLFGVIFLTKMCLPFLRKTKGRIINISSLLGYLAFPLQSLYVASKFALEGFTESLYYELTPHEVQVTLIQPGVHSTNFGINAILSPLKNDLSKYQLQKNNFVKFRETLIAKKKGSSEKIASCVVKLLNMPHMPLRTKLGYDANILHLVKRCMPSFLFNKLMHHFFKRIFLVSP